MGSFKPPSSSSSSSEPPQSASFQPNEILALQAAFDATWAAIQARDPFRDFAADEELKRAVSEKLCALAATGVTNAAELQALVLASLDARRTRPAPAAE
jgi:hypothetical protein